MVARALLATVISGGYPLNGSGPNGLTLRYIPHSDITSRIAGVAVRRRPAPDTRGRGT